MKFLYTEKFILKLFNDIQLIFPRIKELKKSFYNFVSKYEDEYPYNMSLDIFKIINKN